MNRFMVRSFAFVFAVLFIISMSAAQDAQAADDLPAQVAQMLKKAGDPSGVTVLTGLGQDRMEHPLSALTIAPLALSIEGGTGIGFPIAPRANNAVKPGPVIMTVGKDNYLVMNIHDPAGGAFGVLYPARGGKYEVKKVWFVPYYADKAGDERFGTPEVVAPTRGGKLPNGKMRIEYASPDDTALGWWVIGSSAGEVTVANAKPFPVE